jgi:aspartyl-tRNA(Asn)/glutamyl-tRNA(Gln) amidotransferase subunit C
VKKFRKGGNAMKITQETVQYVAALAKLTVSEEEKQSVAKELDQILDYIETMNELDTENIEPMSHVLPVKNVFREDMVVNQDDRDQLVKNAPMSKDGCFVVPKTVE